MMHNSKCDSTSPLTAAYTEGSEDLSRPPAMNDEGIMFDTCVDNVDNPSILIGDIRRIFEFAHAYPAYLVEYA